MYFYVYLMNYFYNCKYAFALREFTSEYPFWWSNLRQFSEQNPQFSFAVGLENSFGFFTDLIFSESCIALDVVVLSEIPCCLQ